MRKENAGASARPQRTRIGQRNVLSVQGKEPGYHYRIVNDTGDRIQAFIDAGYELVDAKSVSIGDKRVNQASPEGSKAQVSVGKGDKAFLMRIKEEWFNEDQEAKRLENERLMQSIKQSASSNADYGSIEISK